MNRDVFNIFLNYKNNEMSLNNYNNKSYNKILSNFYKILNRKYSNHKNLLTQ